MESSNQRKSVKLEHVISVQLIGDKAKMQNLIINRADQRRELDILRVKGKCNNFEIVEPKAESINRRTTTYIKGAFRADDLVSGNVQWVSGQCILPDSAAAFICAQELPYDVDVTLTLIRAEKSAVGYKFNATLNNVSFEEDTLHEPMTNGASANDAPAPTAAPAPMDAPVDVPVETESRSKRK